MNRARMDREAGLGRKAVSNAFGIQQTACFSPDGGLDSEAITRLPGSPAAKQLCEKTFQEMDGRKAVLWGEVTRRPNSKWDVKKGIAISMPEAPSGNYVIVSWLRSAYLLVVSVLGQSGYQYAA